MTLVTTMALSRAAAGSEVGVTACDTFMIELAAEAARLGFGASEAAGAQRPRPAVENGNVVARSEHEIGNVECVGERVLAERRVGAAIAVAAGIGCGVVQLHHFCAELVLCLRLDLVLEPREEAGSKRTGDGRWRIDRDLGVAPDGLHQDGSRSAANAFLDRRQRLVVDRDVFEKLVALGLGGVDFCAGPRDRRLIAGKDRALDMSGLAVGQGRHLVDLGARRERQRDEKREDQTSKATGYHVSRPVICPAKLVVSAIGC